MQSLRQLGPSLCLSMFGVFGLAASGCKDDPDVFVCSSPDQCNGGICQPTRYCSFPDPTCGSGQRYGSLAGDGLADTCVRGSMSGDEGEDVGSESESASATATTGSTTAGSTTSSSTPGSTTSTSSTSSTSKGSSSTSSTTEDLSSSDSDGSSSESSSSSTGEAESSSGSTGDDTDGDSGPVISCQPDTFDDTRLGSLWTLGADTPETYGYAIDEGQLALTVDPSELGTIVVSTRRASDRYDSTFHLELGSVETAASTPGIQFAFGVGPGWPELLEFQILGIDLIARYGVEGEDGVEYIEVWDEVYTPALHRHLRFRIEGAGDAAVFYWETSGDGEEWDVQAELPQPAEGYVMSNAIVQVLAGTIEESTETTADPFTIEFYEQCRTIWPSQTLGQRSERHRP